MSFGLLVKDQLLVVLTKANNYKYSNSLTIPIQQVSSCRIISTEIIVIQANFIQSSYVYNPDSNIPTLTSGIAITGDNKTYYKTNTDFITNIDITLYDSLFNEDKAYTLLFQFI